MKRLILSLLTVFVSIALLFVYNGLSKPQPQHGKTSHVEASHIDTLTVMAYNLAKCYVFKSDTFRSVRSMENHLDQVAKLLVSKQPDLVFLSEVVGECGPCPVNQVEYLAEKAGFPYWAFGENYSWGLPFFRMKSGNGILSRFPLDSLEVVQLAGAKSFYNPTNNRRLLRASVQINELHFTIASIHNDSYSKENNFKQTLQILKMIDRNAILGGDFNAEGASLSMQSFRESGRFIAAWKSPPTFPARDPKKTIDFILAPANWHISNHSVIKSRLSDHLPVVSSFKLQNVN